MLDVLGQKIDVTSERAFGQVLGELRADVYEFERVPIEDGDVIIDIGAHIGIFSCYVASKYPKARVLAFEPAQVTFADLERNTAPYKNITAYNFGLYDKPEMALQYLPEANYSSSAHYTKNIPGSITEIIKCLTLDEIIEMAGKVKFLKMDCEGAEWDALKNCNNLSKVTYLSCELHTGLPCTDEAGLAKALRPHFNMDTFRGYRVNKEVSEGV